MCQIDTKCLVLTAKNRQPPEVKEKVLTTLEFNGIIAKLSREQSAETKGLRDFESGSFSKNFKEF